MMHGCDNSACHKCNSVNVLINIDKRIKFDQTFASNENPSSYMNGLDRSLRKNSK